MSPENFISSRLHFKGGIATAGVAVSFAVIIVAIAISTGFRTEIRNAVSDICADVQLPSDADTSALSLIDGIAGVDKVLYKSGIVKKGDSVHGIMLKGSSFADTASLCARIPRRLADLLEFSTGDKMLVYFISDRVQARNFTVTELYDNPVEVDGVQMVHVPYDDLSRLESMNSSQEYEIRLDDRFRTMNGMRSKAFEISCVTGEMASASCDRYSNLFDWLQLIDGNVVAILVLMSLVAGFNMISALLILLFRSTSTIGTLKSVGMTDRAISKVFLKLASGLVLKGILIGNGIGLAICLVQDLTHLIKLNPANYFVSFVPIDINILWVVAADAFAYVVIMLLELLPTIFISKVDPARTVRAR